MAKKPNIRFAGFEDDWEQRKFSELYAKSSEKNDGSIGMDRNITVATMQFKEDVKVSTAEYLKTYYTFNLGDIAFEGHQSKEFRYGRFVENDIGNGIVSHIFAVFRPIKEFDLQFWKYAINNEMLMQRILSRSTKASTMMHDLVTEDFLNETFLVPSLNEQKQIGTYLKSIDHLITLHQRKCDELKKVKKFMLQKMFPKKGEKNPEIRFDGFTNDWEQRKLGDVVEFLDTMRKPLEGAKRISGPYPYYGASGIVDYVDGYLFDEELVLLSEDGANITDRNYPVCFLASGKYWVNNHAHVLKTKDGNENNFICNSLERKDYKQYNSGMAMPKLNQEVCRGIPISCPSFDEQKKIGDYFSNLDHLITLHQRKCEELKNVKKYMLQNMFAKGE